MAQLCHAQKPLASAVGPKLLTARRWPPVRLLLDCLTVLYAAWPLPDTRQLLPMSLLEIYTGPTPRLVHDAIRGDGGLPAMDHQGPRRVGPVHSEQRANPSTTPSPTSTNPCPAGGPRSTTPIRDHNREGREEVLEARKRDAVCQEDLTTRRLLP